MAIPDNLSSGEALRSAITALGGPENWDVRGRDWLRDLAGTIEWVRAADQKTRSTKAFQRRLWEENYVAAVGQGSIKIDEALEDAPFREWLAERSMAPLPAVMEERVEFLTQLNTELTSRLDALLTRKKTPRLKIFRVLTALYPEAMTTIASRSKVKALAKSMGLGSLPSIQAHLLIRQRLDAVLGPAASEPLALADRIALPWRLYARFVEPGDGEADLNAEAAMAPLPAALRRRGLTAVRGLFQGLLSTLEFVKDGVTRDELLDFLRAEAPESKNSTLGVIINCFQSELGTLRTENGRYVLTKRGQAVLDSQDPNQLSDWILTHILGADRALTELRDRGALAPAVLAAAIRSMNPGWKSDFVPQAIVSWFRSMGLVETKDSKHVLTDTGREWAARVRWTPEPLESDAVDVVTFKPVIAPLSEGDVTLPGAAEICAGIQKAGWFPNELVARLHAGLWANPRRHFAVLTGLSGAGKTLLAREYARAITTSEDQRITLPIQPGWYDPGSLLGFVNPLRPDSYVRTPFLDFLIAAAGDPNKPYVAVLDEMNLSHPEQYMAPLLSAMETGGFVPFHTEDEFFDGVPRSIGYPRNLVLIGTVNMDETTHGLSDKVLDRAFVLDFWEIDLGAYPRWGTFGLKDVDEKRVREVLVGLLDALAPARLHFGWRLVDDVLQFLTRAAATGVLPFPDAVDSVVYGKVLPKLRGDDTDRFRTALKNCEDVTARFELTRSRAKLAELRRDLETTGSARFWR